MPWSSEPLNVNQRERALPGKVRKYIKHAESFPLVSDARSHASIGYLGPALVLTGPS